MDSFGAREGIRYTLRELETYMLRDSPRTVTTKAPSPQPTSRYFKETHKGNGQPRSRNGGPCKSSGASGGCLQGGASFKVEKAHLAARKKGPENRKSKVKLRPPLCRPLKHSMSK